MDMEEMMAFTTEHSGLDTKENPAPATPSRESLNPEDVDSFLEKLSDFNKGDLIEQAEISYDFSHVGMIEQYSGIEFKQERAALQYELMNDLTKVGEIRDYHNPLNARAREIEKARNKASEKRAEQIERARRSYLEIEYKRTAFEMLKLKMAHKRIDRMKSRDNIIQRAKTLAKQRGAIRYENY